MLGLAKLKILGDKLNKRDRRRQKGQSTQVCSLHANFCAEAVRKIGSAARTGVLLVCIYACMPVLPNTAHPGFVAVTYTFTQAKHVGVLRKKACAH